MKVGIGNSFEKIPEYLKKGVKIGVSKSKEQVEITKLKSETKDVQRLIESKFNTLGKKVFEMLNKNALNDELRKDYKDILFLFKKITDLENAIKQIRFEILKATPETDIVIFFKCGSVNKPDSKFCVSCGSPIEESEGEVKTCSICGAPVKEGAKFCIKCGTKYIS
jgi:ribosomal protein L40E